MLRSIGRLAAGACTICEQHEQENFGRTYRMTLNCSGTRSRTSLTSSPRYRSLPPQLGQGLSAGTGGCDTVSRGRLAGKGLRRLTLQLLGRVYRRKLLDPRGFERLDRELELINPLIEPLGGAPIAGPLELREEQRPADESRNLGQGQ